MKRKFIILLVFLMFCTLLSYADEGFIVAGWTNSYTHGGSDFLVYKIDLNGTKQWENNYGGTNDDYGYSIQQTSDGGYIVAGWTQSFVHGTVGEDSDFLVYKLDSNGTKQWRKNYGGTNDDYGYSITQTSDGGYIVAGYSDTFTNGGSDFLVYKLDSNGTKQWRKNYGGTNDDYGYSIQQTSDGGYIVAGWTQSFVHGTVGEDSDFLVYKLDSNGTKQWRKNYGGTNDDYGYSICQTSDGGYIVAGWTQSFVHGTVGEDSDFLVYKLDSNGTKQWRKNYGGTNDDYGYSITQTSDGGYIVAGWTQSFVHGTVGEDSDFLVYKLDSNGTKQWRKNYGGTNDDYGYSITQTSDGGYIVAGYSDTFTNGGSDFLVYKLDSNGTKQWRKNYGGTSHDRGQCVKQVDVKPNPTHLFAKRMTNGKVFLGWRMVNYTHESGYNIYRSTTSGNYNDPINANPITDRTSFLDESAPSSECYYIVRMVDSNNNEIFESTEVSVPASSTEGVNIYKTITGIAPDEVYGIAKVGDVNGDGLPDFLIIYNNNNETKSAHVKIYTNDGNCICDINLGETKTKLLWVPWTLWDLDQNGKDEVIGIKKTGNKYYLYIIDSNSDTNGADWITGGGDILASTEVPSTTISSLRYKTIAIAYLNGLKPYIMYGCGHSTNTWSVHTYEWNNDLSETWYWPLNTNNDNLDSSHQFEVADIDENGKDEVFYGVYVFDENGFRGIWGNEWSHMDGVHIGDINPNIDGQEVYFHQEQKPPGGTHVTNKDGVIIWSRQDGGDCGCPYYELGHPKHCTENPRDFEGQHADNGWIADVVQGYNGMEVWVRYKNPTKHRKNAAGECVGCMYNPHLIRGFYPDNPSCPPIINDFILKYPIDWDGDPYKEVLYGNTIKSLNYEGTGFKATPNIDVGGSSFKLVMDIIGDYREEMVVFDKYNDGKLRMRIFTNTDVLYNKKISPSENRQYLQKHRWAGH